MRKYCYKLTHEQGSNSWNFGAQRLIKYLFKKFAKILKIISKTPGLFHIQAKTLNFTKMTGKMLMSRPIDPKSREQFDRYLKFHYRFYLHFIWTHSASNRTEGGVFIWTLKASNRSERVNIFSCLNIGSVDA